MATKFEPDPGFHDRLVADTPAKRMAEEIANRIAQEATAEGQQWARTYRARAVSALEGATQDSQGRWRGQGGKFVKTFGMRVEGDALPRPRSPKFGGIGSWIEFGVENTPPRAPLRRAVENCGYELGE